MRAPPRRPRNDGDIGGGTRQDRHRFDRRVVPDGPLVARGTQIALHDAANGEFAADLESCERLEHVPRQHGCQSRLSGDQKESTSLDRALHLHQASAKRDQAAIVVAWLGDQPHAPGVPVERDNIVWLNRQRRRRGRGTEAVDDRLDDRGRRRHVGRDTAAVDESCHLDHVSRNQHLLRLRLDPDTDRTALDVNSLTRDRVRHDAFRTDTVAGNRRRLETSDALERDGRRIERLASRRLDDREIGAVGDEDARRHELAPGREAGGGDADDAERAVHQFVRRGRQGNLRDQRMESAERPREHQNPTRPLVAIPLENALHRDPLAVVRSREQGLGRGFPRRW